MPHAAFRGQTPDEVFFGMALNLAAELDDARSKAREHRLAANRSASCGRCAPAAGPTIPP
jgi:putative transposase